MTPEQAAAYINAQTAMMLVALEMLKAKYHSISVDAYGNFQAQFSAIPADEIRALQERYEHVLGENAVLATFQHANMGQGR